MRTARKRRDEASYSSSLTLHSQTTFSSVLNRPSHQEPAESETRCNANKNLVGLGHKVSLQLMMSQCILHILPLKTVEFCLLNLFNGFCDVYIVIHIICWQINYVTSLWTFSWHVIFNYQIICVRNVCFTLSVVLTGLF